MHDSLGHPNQVHPVAGIVNDLDLLTLMKIQILDFFASLLNSVISSSTIQTETQKVQTLSSQIVFAVARARAEAAEAQVEQRVP